MICECVPSLSVIQRDCFQKIYEDNLHYDRDINISSSSNKSYFYLFVAGSGSVLIIRSLSLSSGSLNPSLDSTQSLQFSGWLLVLARETLRGIMVLSWHHSLALFLLSDSYSCFSWSNVDMFYQAWTLLISGFYCGC